MRSRAFLLVAVFLVVVLGGVGAVYAYDSSKKDTIAKGVTVGGIDVSGLTKAQAKRRLTRLYVPELRRPVTVHALGRTFRLTAAQAGVRANLDAMVDQALARSRSGNIVTRTERNLTGKSLDVSLQPSVTYRDAAVRRLVANVGRAVDRPAQDAGISFAGGAPTVTSGHDGRRLRRASLTRGLQTALAGEGSRQITARTAVVHPKTSTAEVAKKYPVVLALDRTTFHLSLYKNLKLVKTYTVAVGQQGLETPAGLYHIQNKAVDPAWHVPNSAWAGSLQGQVIPGGAPNNPIKARWLGIFDGAGIHGTDETASIGHAASHGCVRMLIPDVIELYPQVPVGAPIYIA